VAQRLFSSILQSLPCVEDLSKDTSKRQNLLGENATVFLDDALLRGGTFEEHLRFIYSFLYAMEEQKLHLSAPKTQFMRDRCNYLGHVLSGDCVVVQPEQVAALREWPVPQSTTDVRVFLGLCVYLRRHIEGFGTYAAPLSTLTNKNAEFEWGPKQQLAFETLRDICCSPRVLVTPCPGLPYQLLCDASGFAAGCSLWQLHTLPDTTTLWKPIEFRSKSFSAAERSKAAHTRELLSFVSALKYFKPFLAGVPFSVITDSSALAWLKTSQDQSPCFQRWWAYVSSFTFTIQHRPGKRIVTEDALSRRPDLEDTTRPDGMVSLPDPDEHRLPDPAETAPPVSFAAPLVELSHIRSPMDHNGVLVQDPSPAEPPRMFAPCRLSGTTTSLPAPQRSSYADAPRWSPPRQPPPEQDGEATWCRSSAVSRPLDTRAHPRA